MSQDPTEALMTVAEQLAREAGTLVRESSGAGVATTKSSGVDLVTEVDQAAEALIRRRLAELRPGDGILGEEEGQVAGTTGLTWIVDPIDGTTNFVYGLPFHSVSIAVAAGEGADPYGWELRAGAVHAPALDRTWTAGRGRGAFADGRRLELGPSAPLGRSLVGTGFAYTADRRTTQAHELTRVLPHVRDIRRLGSAAVDLCLVAEGQLDVFYERFLNPWDMAAGALAVREAGGVVERVGTGEGALTVVGPASLVAELLEVLDPSSAGGPADRA